MNKERFITISRAQIGEYTAFATLEQLKEGRKAIVDKVCGR